MARAKTPGNGTTSRKSVAVMPAPKTVEVQEKSSSVNLSAVNLEEQIRVRAYQLYEERGYTPGHESRRLAGSGAGSSRSRRRPAERLILRTRQRLTLPEPLGGIVHPVFREGLSCPYCCLNRSPTPKRIFSLKDSGKSLRCHSSLSFSFSLTVCNSPLAVASAFLSEKIPIRVPHVTNWQFCASARVGVERIFVPRGSAGLSATRSGFGAPGRNRPTSGHCDFCAGISRGRRAGDLRFPGRFLHRLHLPPQQSRSARALQVRHAVVGAGRLAAVLVAAAGRLRTGAAAAA